MFNREKVVKVKKSKIVIALMLIFLLAFGLAACGSKDGGSGSVGSGEPANSSGKTMEEVLYAAAENIKNAESMTYNMNMDMGMNVFGMKMDTLMDADAKIIQNPLTMEMIGHMDMGEMGEYDMDMYAETKDDGVVMYTGMEMDGEKSWMKTTVDLNSSQLSQYDAQSNIQVYVENAQNFKEVGEEDVDGVKAVRFDGTISGESIGKALEESGMNDQLAGSGVEDPAALYAEMGEIPVSFWVDTEKELIVKYTIDMSESIKKMMDKAMEEAAEESEEAAQMAGLFSIDRSIITMTITGVNNVDAIEIPAEAIDEAVDMDAA